MRVKADILFVVVVLSTDHVKYLYFWGIGYGVVCNPCMSFLPMCIHIRSDELVCLLVGF